MPTGYTEKIKDGISFKEFTLGCARAFGALVQMRDESNDTHIPEEFTVDDFYFTNVTDCKAKLREIRNMSIADAEKAYKLDYDKAEEQRIKYLAEHIDLLEKYVAMRDSILLWTPPTPDHDNLKTFMLEQINSSIEHDCDTSYYTNPAERESVLDWLEQQIASAVESAEYAEEQLKKQKAYMMNTNTWVNVLRNSLK